MPAAPPKKHPDKSKTSTLAKRLYGLYVRPYLGQLLIAVFFMGIAAAMTGLVAKLMQPVLDDVLFNSKKEMIFPVCAAVFVTFTIRGITTYIHTIMMNRIGQNIIADIQGDLFKHFMILDLSFFHENSSGSLVSRIVNDVNIMRLAVTETLTGFGKSASTLVFLVAVMVYQDWKLSFAAFIIFPFVSGFVFYLGKRLRKVSKKIQHELGSLSDLLLQTFQGIRLVKAYGMENHEKEKIIGAVYTVRDLNIKSVRLSNLSTPVNETIVGLIFSCIIAYGGYQVLAGSLTPGQLASFLAAFTLAYEPMKKLAKLNNTLQVGLGAAERVFEMMDIRPDIIESEKPEILSSRTPEITFKNVEFQYSNTELKALNTISFTARAGEVTALVGQSGGGKSTIINLIPRFYDVTGGSILIDGQDIRKLSLTDLRRHIALVSQDITIFNDSILSNIRYGDPSATDEQIIQAAKAAAAHDFIQSFPDCYNTIVGEDGVKLSGGQKQRISIARAILRNAPILLLDEATSALDNESESLVQNALHELEKGRTTIVIAHRLTTVQTAHQILVLDKGKVIENGTHDSLLAKDGAYARMYHTGLKG